MRLELKIRNRQRECSVDGRLLRRIIRTLLAEQLQLEAAELGLTLVAAPEMARVNWQFLQHEGSTDVITFDHTLEQLSRRRADVPLRIICGELYVCLTDAVTQARRFRTTWPEELVRYIVHGVLHLCGHDDHQAGDRRRMKREENRHVRRLAGAFALRRLSVRKRRR